MQTLLDFLTFKRFITADILIVCYYIGALLIPFLLYKTRHYLIENVRIVRAPNNFLKNIFGALETKQKNYFKVVILLIFLAMEVMWRMMFEMMIAYFQMHDYLQQISTFKV
jgi:hypothetical protein